MFPFVPVLFVNPISKYNLKLVYFNAEMHRYSCYFFHMWRNKFCWLQMLTLITWLLWAIDVAERFERLCTACCLLPYPKDLKQKNSYFWLNQSGLSNYIIKFILKILCMCNFYINCAILPLSACNLAYDLTCLTPELSWQPFLQCYTFSITVGRYWVVTVLIGHCADY